MIVQLKHCYIDYIFIFIIYSSVTEQVMITCSKEMVNVNACGLSIIVNKDGTLGVISRSYTLSL